MAHPILEEGYLRRIEPGMDVCDVVGDKVGTVAHVHRYERPPSEAPPGDPSEAPPGEEILEVKTGFLGLGAHLYVPLSAVQEVLESGVFLGKPKEAFKGVGWYDQPAHLA
jgi:hypothetical protein